MAVLKKLFWIIVIIGIGVVFYTEKTGKTHLSKQIYSLVLGEDPDESTEVTTYSLVGKKTDDKELAPGEQAIKDANSYHSEAKKFARDTNNAVNSFNEAVK